MPYGAIDSHEEWYRAVKILLSKRQELISIHDVTLVDTVEVARSDVEAFRQNRVEVRENEAEMRRFESRRQNIHLFLAQQRADRDVRNVLKSEELSVLEAGQQLQREEAIKLAQEKAAETKLHVDLFKQQRAEAILEKERVFKEVESGKVEAMRLQIDANKDKVEHRSELFRQKGEQRKIKELELQKGEVRRLELLAKIAEQVWCWCMYILCIYV